MGNNIGNRIDTNELNETKRNHQSRDQNTAGVDLDMEIIGQEKC